MKEGFEKLNNPIEEYLDKKGSDSKFLDLFEAKKQNVDLRTDLGFEELFYVNQLIFMNNFLINRNLNGVYSRFLNEYLRLKVSLDRKSRGEFVDINRLDRFEQNLNKFANLKTITESKS